MASRMMFFFFSSIFMRDSGIRFYMPLERLGRDPFILYHMQIFGQYIINQYILQNTVEIICKEKVFSMKNKRQEKRKFGDSQTI